MKQIYKIINKMVDENYVLNYLFRSRNASVIICYEEEIFKVFRVENAKVTQYQTFDDAEDFKIILEGIIYEVFEDRMWVK